MAGKSLKEQLSGERFSVSYLLTGEEKEARLKAKDICYEQTVEFPEDLTPAGPIADQIVGQIEQFSPVERPVDGRAGAPLFRALISYAVESAAGNIVQMLNVVFGNTSMKPGVKVERLSFSRRIISAFKGPRFGRDGLRALLGVPSRPLVCTALKPMGLSASELAEQAYKFALGGIDMIKDDHGLSDQPFCPFEERAARCAEAVARASSRTGRKILYMPNVTSPADRLLPAAHRAKELEPGHSWSVRALRGWTLYGSLRRKILLECPSWRTLRFLEALSPPRRTVSAMARSSASSCGFRAPT